MKVLYLELGNQPGTRKAFSELGIDLRSLNYTDYSDHFGKDATNRIFLHYTNEHKPDWIHMQLQMTDIITNNSINEARKISPGVVITNWSGDIRREVPGPLISRSKAVDKTLISNVGQLDKYRQAGITNATYWQIGYDPEYMYPKWEKNLMYDVVFTANCYNQFPDSKLRLQIAEALRNKYGNRAGIFGGGYPSNWRIRSVSMDKINDINNQASCVLSVSNFNDVSHYFSDRLLYCLASGRPTISWRFPGSESYFSDRGDILMSNSILEVLELVDYCRDNVEWANTIGRNGYLKVLGEHTFKSRIMELVHYLGLSGKL